MTPKRAALEVTQTDVEVLQACLAEGRAAAFSSKDVFASPDHDRAADRLSIRLDALARQLTDSEGGEYRWEPARDDRRREGH